MSSLDLLSSFGKQGTTSTDSNYPVIANADATKRATKLVEALVTSRTLEAVIKTSKVELRTVAMTEWLKANKAASEYKTSVVIPTIRDDKGMVAHDLIITFTEGYQTVPAEKKEAITAIVGDEFFDANFSETFALSINSDAVPADKRSKLIEGMIKLMTGLGIDPAEAVKAKAGYSPNDGFNATRIKELSAAANTKLEAVLPTPNSVGEYKKTKTTGAPAKAKAKK